ncbi:MAG: 50S ribosomal protein L23 [Candidatus Doudnabacteria bacterium]|nr:50S ribosomal protein L23 [Candidatus Doudnabacteria bacterium]
MVKESSSAKVSEDKARQLKEDTGRAHRILISGHVSEKANMLSNQNRYIFRVNRQANKIEVKKAVEGAYDVRVIRVNIVNNLGKNRRMGRIMGRTSDWKKAIVTLKQGDKISGLVEGA